MRPGAGFLHETLAIFAVVAAVFAALYFGPWLFSLDASAYRHRVAGDYGGGRRPCFLVVYSSRWPFSARRLSNSVKSSALGPLDRALGAAFGVVRGLVTVGLVLYRVVYFVPAHAIPRHFTHARTLPLMQKTAEVVALPGSQYGHNDFGVHPRDELGRLDPAQ